MALKVKSKKEWSVASGAGIGVLISFVLSILMTMITASLIEGEKIADSSVTIAMLFTSFLSVLVGTVAANRMVNKKIAITSGLVGLCYLLILIGIGVLFFDNGFHNLWTRLLAVAAGCSVSCAICISRKGSGWKRKRAYR